MHFTRQGSLWPFLSSYHNQKCLLCYRQIFLYLSHMWLETNVFGKPFIWLFFFLTIIFIFVYKWITQNPEALTGKYIAYKSLTGKPSEIVSTIERALKNAGFRRVGFDSAEQKFYAQTQFSMSSWSEYIAVYYQHNDSSTDLQFKSICALPTQLFAWGKNKRNFKKFERELEKLLSNTRFS